MPFMITMLYPNQPYTCSLKMFTHLFVLAVIGTYVLNCSLYNTCHLIIEWLDSYTSHMILLQCSYNSLITTLSLLYVFDTYD